MTGRRRHDPFAPHPAPLAAVKKTEPVLRLISPLVVTDEDSGDGDGDGPDSPEGTALEYLTKRELIAIAKGVGVAIYGTKYDIIDRINAVT